MTIESSHDPPPPPEQPLLEATRRGASADKDKDNDRDDATAYGIYDVAVIGGGVVGLSILREATLQGYRACLVERNEHLLCGGASGRNSGIACTGVDAPVGSLERGLIRESVSSFRIHCRRHNVPHRDCGSLVCAWPWDNENDSQGDEPEEANHDELDNNWEGQVPPSAGQPPTKRLASVLKQSHEAGDAHATYLPPDQVQALEPHLHPECRGAVHIPDEIVVDPWLFPVSLAVQARENGALVFTNFAVDLKRSSFDAAARVWTLVAMQSIDATASMAVARNVRARAVVNAAGVWADVVDRGLLPTPPPYESRPRRGQYLVVRPRLVDSVSEVPPEPIGQALWEKELALPPLVLEHPIQPVPTHHTKGVFVFSSLYRQIVVGPTALDQDDRQNDAPCPAVRRQLAKTLRRTLRLSADYRWEVVGEYVGIRPGTDHRDFQIHLQADRCWATCAGIRSTGLTASLGIGRHVVYLLRQGVLPTMKPPPTIRTTPLPPLDKLLRDYRARNDGSVHIGGHVYRVTHPLTKLGWDGTDSTSTRPPTEGTHEVTAILNDNLFVN